MIGVRGLEGRYVRREEEAGREERGRDEGTEGGREGGGR